MRKATVADIIAAVSHRTQTQVRSWGYAKRGPVAAAREAAVLIARRLTYASYPEIAAEVGQRSHSSVRDAHHRAERRERREPEFAAMVADLTLELKAAHPTPTATMPDAVRDLHARSLAGMTFSQAEIARAYGVSRNAISIVEKRAIGRLRDGLLADPYIREWLGERGLDVEIHEGSEA